MADRSDELVLEDKVTDDAEHLRVSAELLRGSSSRDENGVVVVRIDIVVADIRFDCVAEFFGVAVEAGLEVMNDQLQSFLAGRRDDRFDAIFSQPVDG